MQNAARNANSATSIPDYRARQQTDRPDGEFGSVAGRSGVPRVRTVLDLDALVLRSRLAREGGWCLRVNDWGRAGWGRWDRCRVAPGQHYGVGAYDVVEIKVVHGAAHIQCRTSVTQVSPIVHYSRSVLTGIAVCASSGARQRDLVQARVPLIFSQRSVYSPTTFVLIQHSAFGLNPQKTRAPSPRIPPECRFHRALGPGFVTPPSGN
jgi:hypothetical protein